MIFFLNLIRQFANIFKFKMAVIRASIKQRQRITSAFVAFVIVFAVYLVLHLHFDLSASRRKSKCLKNAR